jgi:hypothetical protein
MKFNINDSVRVILTRDGERVLKDKGMVYFGHNYDQESKKLDIQMWQIMQIFGDDCYMGGPHLFENNTFDVTGGSK